MSSEVCPFCGKSYKRLKSHLPHCKAAPGSNTPPTSHGAAQTSPKKLTGPQSKKGKNVSAVPSPGLQARNPSSARSAESASPPSSAKKKKQKLSEQIRAAVVRPSAAASLTSQPHGPTPGTKNKIGDDLSKATGPQKFTKGPQKRTVSEKLTTAEHVVQTETKIRTENDNQPSPEPKMNVSEKRTQALSVTHNDKTDDGARNKDWLITGNVESLNGHQSKIILQDVKAMLARNRQSLRSSSILVQIQSGTSSRVASPLRPDTSPQPAPASPLTPLSPQGHLGVQGLARLTGTKPLPAETLRKRDGPDATTKGELELPRLAQVRLKDLPGWLASNTPTHPRELVKMVQTGWLWYYRKYIDVKKGGVGGVGMLLAGYCVLSYIWSYPHIKRDRWRKFH